jgi:hypothetical protein
MEAPEYGCEGGDDTVFHVYKNTLKCRLMARRTRTKVMAINPIVDYRNFFGLGNIKGHTAPFFMERYHVQTGNMPGVGFAERRYAGASASGAADQRYFGRRAGFRRSQACQ